MKLISIIALAIFALTVVGCSEIPCDIPKLLPGEEVLVTFWLHNYDEGVVEFKIVGLEHDGSVHVFPDNGPLLQDGQEIDLLVPMQGKILVEVYATNPKTGYATNLLATKELDLELTKGDVVALDFNGKEIVFSK